MKKSLILLSLAGAIAISSCGPSAEEKAAAEKAIQDSIAAAQKAIDDSLAAVAAAQAAEDSMRMAMEQARLDSIALADSMAAAAAKGKVKPKPKKKEAPKDPKNMKDLIKGQTGSENSGTGPKSMKDLMKDKK